MKKVGLYEHKEEQEISDALDRSRQEIIGLGTATQHVHFDTPIPRELSPFNLESHETFERKRKEDERRHGFFRPIIEDLTVSEQVDNLKIN